MRRLRRCAVFNLDEFIHAFLIADQRGALADSLYTHDKSITAWKNITFYWS